MPDETSATVTVSLESALTPAVAFATFIEELVGALDRASLSFTPGPDGRIAQGDFEVGRVTEWTPGKRARLQWRQADWQPDILSEVEVRIEPTGADSRILLAHHGWGGLIGDPAELVGWFASETAAPFLSNAAPAALGDWLIDRSGRRPSGAQARGFYRDPLYHKPNFRVILAELDLTPSDYLLEVGCGGGALLKELLKSGCRAAAIDHSRDMVQLASEENRDAIAEGRLTIQQAEATNLPFAEATFTHAIMT
ncbi:MAG: methyltransferase domain-containing protein, partial [Chloroflexota bacterium]|nr:methyltransferase domain-containing protein [Chloroflexota bacterium]